MTSQNPKLNAWVQQIATLCQPDQVRWCDGSDAENRALLDAMVAEKALVPLNAEKYPGGYYARSNPNDVARTELVTASGAVVNGVFLRESDLAQAEDERQKYQNF